MPIPDGNVVDNPGTDVQPSPAPEPVNPLRVEDPPVADNNNVDPAPTPDPTPDPAADMMKMLHDMGLTKFDSLDKFAKSYQEMERFSSGLSQKNAALEKALNDFYQRPTNPQDNPAAPVDNGANLMDQLKQEWNKRIEEDPLGALDFDTMSGFLEKMMSGKMDELKNMITPLVDRQYAEDVNTTWNNYVTDIVQKHSDFAEFQPAIYDLAQTELGQVISKLFTDNPELGRIANPYEVFYGLVKAQSSTPSQGPVDPLTDPEIRQRILADEGIRNEIIKHHMENIANKDTPTVLGSQIGGAPPALPPEKPKNLREGTKMFLANGG